MRLHGRAEALKRELGISRIHVSIADTKDYVTAVAVAEGKEETQ